MMRFVKVIPLMFASVFAVSLCATGADPPPYLVSVGKFYSQTDVLPGEEFTIRIVVSGWDEYSHDVVPFDAVLILDKSESMGEDGKIKEAKAAAISFVRKAQAASAGAANPVRIGVVKFATGASIHHPISDDYASIIEEISNIDATGDATNLAGGIAAAQGLLAASDSPTRIAILLTDGRAYPDRDGQRQVIEDILLPAAKQAGTPFYTIGIGSDADEYLLYRVARETGAEFTPVSDIEALEDVYTRLFDEIAHTAITCNIVLRERVDTSVVEIIADSWTLSSGIPLPAEDVMQQFLDTGDVDVPMGRLSRDENCTFTFSVRTRQCLSMTDVRDVVELHPNQQEGHASEVTFFFKGEPRRCPVESPPVYCHKLPVPRVDKQFNDDFDEVVLTIENPYFPSYEADNTVRNVHVVEQLSTYFQYLINSASPAPAWFIPTRHYDILYWEIGNLKPQEKVELRFRIGCRAYKERDWAPLPVNYETKGVFGWVVADIPNSSFPNGIRTRTHFPQAYANVVMESVPGGRPDLYVEPPLTESEARIDGGLDWYTRRDWTEEYDQFLAEFGGEPWQSWPTTCSLMFKYWQSCSIWVDSEYNGFVTDWGPPDDPTIVSEILSHQDMVEVDLSESGQHYVYAGVQAQGDAFLRRLHNRVYVSFVNVGEAHSPRVPEGLKLSVYDYESARWDLLAVSDIPPVAADETGHVYFELPPDTLAGRHLLRIPLSPFTGYHECVWRARLRIELVASPTERHTSNNISNEEILVYD